MIKINPKKLPGKWREGYALDYHALRSEFIGYDEYGHPTFDTKRSEIGELLYQLKYTGCPRMESPQPLYTIYCLVGNNLSIYSTVSVAQIHSRTACIG